MHAFIFVLKDYGKIFRDILAMNKLLGLLAVALFYSSYILFELCFCK